MFRFFKYALLGLLMLDVAVAPRACDKRNNNTPLISNAGEVHFMIYEELQGDAVTFVDSSIFWDKFQHRNDFQIGDVITSEMFFEFLDEYEISSNRYPGYSEYIIVVKSVSSNDQKQSNFPFTLTEDTIHSYYNGVRDAFCIDVVIEFIVESDNVDFE